MSLGKEEGLGGIIESKGVDGWDKLIKVLADCLPNLLIGIAHLYIVHAFKHLDYVLGKVEDGSDEEDAEEKVDQ